MCALQGHPVHYLLHGLLTSQPCLMKQPPCFQLRNGSLWKFKGSYVIAEAAVQHPPEREAAPGAASPEVSWLWASVGPCGPAQGRSMRMPDQPQKYSRECLWMGLSSTARHCLRAGAQCTLPACLSTWGELARLIIPWTSKHCSNTSIKHCIWGCREFRLMFQPFPHISP